MMFGLSACRFETRSTAHLSDAARTSKLNALHYDYLTNSSEGAKLDMLRALDLLNSSTNALQAHDGCWFAYGRLFLIESLAGNSNVASIYYEKARYWYLTHLEDMAQSPSAIASNLEIFSKERCKALMLEWDRGVTGGRGPQFYLDSIAQQGRGGDDQGKP